MKYCLGFCFSTDRSYVALIHKEKPEWQRGKINGIGGKVEPNESTPDCMIREFREETGVTITDWIFLCELSGSWGKVVMWKCFNDAIFNVKTIEGERVEIFKVSEIPWDKTIPNLKWIIPMALDKDNVTGIILES